MDRKRSLFVVHIRFGEYFKTGSHVLQSLFRAKQAGQVTNSEKDERLMNARPFLQLQILFVFTHQFGQCVARLYRALFRREIASNKDE